MSRESHKLDDENAHKWINTRLRNQILCVVNIATVKAILSKTVLRHGRAVQIGEIWVALIVEVISIPLKLVLKRGVETRQENGILMK